MNLLFTRLVAPFRWLLAGCMFAAAVVGVAAPPELPPGYPPGQYDEDRVPAFTLPEVLVSRGGDRVDSVEEWREQRRPEILALFREHVYGTAPIGRPPEMTWTVGAPETVVEGDTSARTKTVTLLFAGRDDGPRMDVRVMLPPSATPPVPVFLMVGTGYPPRTQDKRSLLPGAATVLLTRGYGLVTCDVTAVEPDRRDGYAEGIRAFYAGSAEARPAPDAWGAIAAWAWAASRALDYLESDPEVDATRVAIVGFSRFGKAAVWAGAQDERFAVVCSGLSGTAGATLVRRGYGETVANITTYAPHWFARNFLDYAGRVNELPVDWHMLLACVAPRPLYLATAAEDYWNDPHGQYLTAVAAEPVYRLFGLRGIGLQEPPPLGVSVGDRVGYHRRPEGHALTPFDLTQFAEFADRYLKPAD